MTTPSNANTSGLEAVRWLVTVIATGAQDVHEKPLFDTEFNHKRFTCEPLVTAASAQARIAELEARVAKLEAAKWDVKHVDTMNDMVAMGLARDAAEARADRLADGLRRAAVDLAEARDMLRAWGAYVDPQFQEKHDLEGDIGRLTIAHIEARNLQQEG